MTDVRGWVRAGVALAATGVVYLVTSLIAAWIVVVREQQVIDALEARGMLAPDGFRAIWADQLAESTFAAVTAAVFLLTFVAADAVHRRRWVPPLVATVALAAWSATTWTGSSCALPWPAPIQPVGASSLNLQGADAAATGPLVLAAVIWLAYALARVPWGRPEPVAVPRGPGLAIAVPLSVVWVLAATAAAVTIGSGRLECWHDLPPWWMVLIVVPVSAVASGRGVPQVVLLLVATALIGADLLADAAFTLDGAPLLVLACAVAAILGAFVWRPVARGIAALQP